MQRAFKCDILKSKGVLCCIVTYTSHLSIFLNGVATDTVDAVLHGFHYFTSASETFVLRSADPN